MHKRLHLFIFLSLFSTGVYTQRSEPILEWQWQFECESISLSGVFTYVQGISHQNEWECERYTTSNGRETSSCLPSQLVVKPIFFERTLTTDQDFWNWRDLVANGNMEEARSNCTIKAFSRSYEEVLSYTLYNAWPASVSIEPVGTMIQDKLPLDNNGKHHAGKAALMERITVIHEGIALGSVMSSTPAFPDPPSSEAYLYILPDSDAFANYKRATGSEKDPSQLTEADILPVLQSIASPYHADSLIITPFLGGVRVEFHFPSIPVTCPHPTTATTLDTCSFLKLATQIQYQTYFAVQASFTNAPFNAQGSNCWAIDLTAVSEIVSLGYPIVSRGRCGFYGGPFEISIHAVDGDQPLAGWTFYYFDLYNQNLDGNGDPIPDELKTLDVNGKASFDLKLRSDSVYSFRLSSSSNARKVSGLQFEYSPNKDTEFQIDLAKF